MRGKSTLGILVSVILLSGILGVISFEDADAKKPREIVVVGSKAKDLEKELLLDQCTFTLLSPTGESTIIQDAKKKNKVSLKIPDDAEITAVQCLFVDGSIGEEFTVELGEDGKTKVTVIHPRTVIIDSFFDVFVETDTTPNSFFDVFFEVDSFFDVFFDIETPRDSTCPDGEELKLNDDSSIWECAPADTVDSFFDVFFDLLAWHEIQDDKITDLEERIAVLEAGLPPPPTGDEIPKQGLAAEWLFEDDTLDTSSNSNDGTLNGATFVDGKIGRALSFDGVNDIVIVPNNPTLNFDTGSLSISAWIKTTDTNAWIVEHRRNNDGDYRGWDLDIVVGEASGRIRDGSANDVLLKSADITDDVFHHVAYVVDRTTQTALIYLDGALENTADISSVGNIDQNTMGINIGYTSSPNTPNAAYEGIIDQIRIYNRALLQSEVTALFSEVIG